MVDEVVDLDPESGAPGWVPSLEEDDQESIEARVEAYLGLESHRLLARLHHSYLALCNSYNVWALHAQRGTTSDEDRTRLEGQAATVEKSVGTWLTNYKECGDHLRSLVQYGGQDDPPPSVSFGRPRF